MVNNMRSAREQTWLSGTSRIATFIAGALVVWPLAVHRKWVIALTG